MRDRGSKRARDRQTRLQGRRHVPLSRRQQNAADVAESQAMAADALAFIKREREADEAPEPPERVILDPDKGDGGDNGGPPKPDDSEQGAAADTGEAGTSSEAEP